VELVKTDDCCRNVEIKARVKDHAAVAVRARAVADSAPIERVQEDTFFRYPEGRLKLRKYSDNKGELIFYARADATSPRESRYRVLPTSSPDVLICAFSEQYGILGRVQTRRTVFLSVNARIHLDEVDGLGTFVEIEAVLGKDEPVEQGIATVNRLMEKLGIRKEDLVGKAYIDLLGES